jgi:valyl-tRNA synthetase
VAALEATGAVAGRYDVVEHTARCGRCGTVLVPSLGRHWFLPMADLEVAAADAAREGLVSFAPATARDTFLDRAGRGGDWCLSHQVWAGLPVPVGRCLDCGQLEVSVDPLESCGKCMGTVVPEDDVLDARFVGAVWPLASSGWPVDEGGPEAVAPETTLLVGPSGIAKWSLPMAALGLRLVGVVPFCCVAVNHVESAPDDPDPRLPVDLTAIVDNEGARVVRAALVAGGLDVDVARRLVSAVDEPPDGDADVDALTEAYEGAFSSGTPSVAVHLLRAALDTGVRAESADRVRALAAPILGD